MTKIDWILRRCFDCGRFIPKRFWLKSRLNLSGMHQRPLCQKCKAEYDPYPQF